MGTERSDRFESSTNDFANNEMGKAFHICSYEDEEEKQKNQKSKYLDCDMITCGAITME